MNDESDRSMDNQSAEGDVLEVFVDDVDSCLELSFADLVLGSIGTCIDNLISILSNSR